MKAYLFFVTLTLLLLTSLFHIFTSVSIESVAVADTMDTYHHVTVKPGDSLWRLAEEYSANQQTGIWDMIELIQHENQLKSAYIYPGQVLVIPTEE